MEILFVTLLVCSIVFSSYIIFNKMERNTRKLKCEIRLRISNYYESEIDNIEKLPLAGIGNDGNSDFEFIQAVRKIKLLDDIKVQIHD